VPGPSAGRPRNENEGRRRHRDHFTRSTKARKLHLTDEIHDRIWQDARQQKTIFSAAANDSLDKSLPRYKVERVG
jgi:hypothetical protein